MSNMFTINDAPDACTKIPLKCYRSIYCIAFGVNPFRTDNATVWHPVAAKFSIEETEAISVDSVGQGVIFRTRFILAQMSLVNSFFMWGTGSLRKKDTFLVFPFLLLVSSYLLLPIISKFSLLRLFLFPACSVTTILVVSVKVSGCH
jgi:hypothetical protein